MNKQTSNIKSVSELDYYKPSDSEIENGTYERSACPALNILANYKYINNNGKNINRKSVVDGMYKAFGVEKYITTFLVIMAQLIFCIDHHTNLAS